MLTDLIADAQERAFARYDNHDADAARGVVLAALSELEAAHPEIAPKVAAARGRVVALFVDGDPAAVRADVAGIFAGLADSMGDTQPATPAEDEDGEE